MKGQIHVDGDSWRSETEDLVRVLRCSPRDQDLN